MRKEIILTALSALLLLSGCKKQSPDDMPPDTPYNHGRYAIMETENGFYSNAGTDIIDDTICLRFYERDTDKQVYLCARPECQHNGSENCAATYKALSCVNSVLYSGGIYVLALENSSDSVSYNLYKAELDGTAITKVGTAFSVNTSDTEYEYQRECFIIHKGYAYIPYHISFGNSSFGSGGNGLVRMNITDGSTETILSGEDYFSAYPHNIFGYGDCVYYDMYGINYNSNDGFHAYNITEKTESKTEYFIAAGDNKLFADGGYDTEDGELVPMLMAKDKNGGEWESLIEDGYSFQSKVIPYKDMIIIDDGKGVISVHRDNGEYIGQIGYDAGNFVPSKYYNWKDVLISGDKIYLAQRVEPEGTDADIMEFNNLYKTYSCPIEDIAAGKGEWKLEYAVKSEYAINAEQDYTLN